MNEYTKQTLIILERLGLDFGYPDFSHGTLVGENKVFTEVPIVDSVRSNRSLEQSPTLKFTLMFSLLDAFIDSEHSEMEGKTFRDKYHALPGDTELQKIFKELYRVAKLLRNALVHNASKVTITPERIDVHYEKRKEFSIKITHHALKSFYTAIVMFVKGDLGNGAYFQAVISTLYANVRDGIADFKDDFDFELLPSLAKYKMNLFNRQIIMNPPISFDPFLKVHLEISALHHPIYQGLDFAITHRDEKLLIPVEALNADLEISEAQALSDWKYQGQFPPFEPVGRVAASTVDA